MVQLTLLYFCGSLSVDRSVKLIIKGDYMENSISQKFNSKSLLLFTLPSMIMMLFIAIYGMINTIFLSRFAGEVALAATSVVFPVTAIALAIAVMYATGSNAIISANIGAGELDKARQNFTKITLVGVVTGIILAALAIIFKTQIVTMLGATDEIMTLSETYLISYAPSFIFIFLQIFAQYFFVTIGKPFLGFIFISIGGLTSIVTSYVLIGIVGVGIIGAGISTVVAGFIPSIIFLWYFTTHKECVLHFVKPKNHKNFLLNTCANGSSEMVTNLAIAVTAATTNIILGNLVGNDGIAAASVNGQMQFLLNSIFIGFGAGIAPILGYAQGSQNREQTKNVFWISTKFVAIGSSIIVLLCFLISDNIISLFLSPDSTAFIIAQSGFKIFMFGFLFSGMNIYASVFFTSVSNGKISALISFLRTFVFIMGMLLILPPILKTTGVWLAVPIAEALSVIVSILLLRKYRKIYGY